MSCYIKLRFTWYQDGSETSFHRIGSTLRLQMDDFDRTGGGVTRGQVGCEAVWSGGMKLRGGKRVRLWPWRPTEHDFTFAHRDRPMRPLAARSSEERKMARMAVRSPCLQASPPEQANCISLKREEITHVRSVTGPGRHPMGRVGRILMELGSAEGLSLPTPSRPWIIHATSQG